MLSCWNGINHVAISACQGLMKLWLALGHQKEQWQSYSSALLFASSVLQGPSLPFTQEPDFKDNLTAEWMQTTLPHVPLREAGMCQHAAREESMHLSQQGHRWAPLFCAVLSSGQQEEGPQGNVVVGVI